MDSKEELFRKESLEKVKSPDSLDNYIQVTSPSIWVVLISVIVLLIGFCFWSVFGNVNNSVSTIVRVRNGTAVCFVLINNRDTVTEGMKVRFKNSEGLIEKIENGSEDSYYATLSGIYVIDDGYYEGEIILKQYKPISFIIN